MTETRVRRICERINKTRNQSHASLLWNVIDNRNDPEAYWQIMIEVCPWAFDDERDSNSMHLTPDYLWLLGIMEWAGVSCAGLCIMALMFSSIASAQDVRTWTSNDGKHTREATYVASDATTVCLEYANGEQKKVPLSALKASDRRYAADRVEAAAIISYDPEATRKEMLMRKIGRFVHKDYRGVDKATRTKLFRAEKSARAKAKRLNNRAAFNANVAGAMASARSLANAGHSAVLRSNGTGSIRKTRVYRTHVGKNRAVTTVGNEYLPYSR